MTAPIRDLIVYRLRRARESLEDAHLLADAGRWNPCVNRLYYACFYAVSALLVQEGMSSSRHSGIRSLFNRHFVKTGKISADTARIFNDLFERRQEGDYVLQSFRASFLMRHFYAARLVSPLISTAEADIRALANFCPLAVSV